MNCSHWLQYAIKHKQSGSAFALTPVSVEQETLSRRNMKCLIMFAMCVVSGMASIPDGYDHGRYAFNGHYAGKWNLLKIYTCNYVELSWNLLFENIVDEIELLIFRLQDAQKYQYI